MAEVSWDWQALASVVDLDEAKPGAAAVIMGAAEVLATHPLIGRSVERGYRELVIGSGDYVALYRYKEENDVVFMLSVKHAHQAGYPVKVKPESTG